MQRNRRTFLKYLSAGTATLLGSATWWAAVSKRRSARWLRRFAEDARRSILPAPLKPHPEAWSDDAITLCWLGHTTVLLNFYGIHVLTDPAFSARVGVSLGLGTVGPKRYIAPALTFSELPPVDLVLLSHAHMDHMDLPSLRKLARTTPVVTAAMTQDVLAATRLTRVQELRWNEETTVRTPQGDLHIEAIEVKHWGERWPSEKPRGYNGYILKRENRSLLFGGDTATTSLFKATRSKGPFDLAIMPIGAYRPWIWNHCTPEQALEMSNWAGARFVVPVHHQTFRLSEEPMDEPIERFRAALQLEPERLALSQVGGSFVCPRT